jgi:hypothetical protein
MPVDLAVNLRVLSTELPSRSSIGFGVGVAPDGTSVRFYDDWPTIRHLQEEIDRGLTPEIFVPSDHTILRRRHWAA